MSSGLATRLPILPDHAPAFPLPEELGTEETSSAPAHVLRTSSYTIYVDLPGNSQEMLLVHGYTGAYDKVSRRVATYVRSLAARRPPKPLYGDWSPEPKIEGEVPTPSDQTLDVLKRRGYLTEMSFAEEENFFEKLVGTFHQRSTTWQPSYMVMPTYNCNLRCSYCFQDHMRTDPRYSHLLRMMDPAVVDRIFNAMPEIEALHGHTGDEQRHRSIGFFGGEPLLEACRPIVGYIIDKALAIGTASFWAVSNGTDLEAYEELLSPERIRQIQITIDGPPEEHDKRRIYADGSGSFKKIADNISMALDHGVAINVRINVDRTNIGHLPRMVEGFLARKWDQRPNFSVYASPIRAQNEKTDSKSTYNTWELDQALTALCEQHPHLEIVARPNNGIQAQARRIFSNPEKAMPDFRESFCSAHTGLYIFDAFADIYACWDRTGDPTVRIGQVEETGNVTLNHPVNALWKGRTVASNPVCRRCSYALYCGGGCAVLAFGKTGDYYTSYCDGFASRFRAGVAEAYREHISGAEFVEKAGRLCTE